jgi:hypothetical protein
VKGYTTQLKVTNADGIEYKSPQHLLDALISKFAFDPFEFTRMDEKKQEELVRRVLGLDTTAIEARRKEAYDRRTFVHGELKKIEARNKGMEEFPGAPGEELSIADLSAELADLHEWNNKCASYAREVENFRTSWRFAEQRFNEADAEVTRLNELLKAANEARTIAKTKAIEEMEGYNRKAGRGQSLASEADR